MGDAVTLTEDEEGDVAVIVNRVRHHPRDELPPMTPEVRAAAIRQLIALGWRKSHVQHRFRISGTTVNECLGQPKPPPKEWTPYNKGVPFPLTKQFEPGQQIGQWTVIERAGSTPGRSASAKWRCQCSCGRIVDVIGKSLRLGKSSKCDPCARAARRIPGSRRRSGRRKTPFASPKGTQSVN